MLKERRNSESDMEDFKKFSNETPKLKVPDMQQAISTKFSDI